MTDRRVVVGTFLLVAGVSIALALAGGAGGVLSPDFAGDSGGATDAADGDTGASATRHASIEIDPTEYDGANDALTLRYSASAYGYDDFEYDRFQLCLYDENGTVLHSQPIDGPREVADGEFVAEETIEVTVSELPRYVVVDHPDLRSDDRVEHEAMVRLSEDEPTIEVTVDELHDAFGYPRSEDVGECG